MNYIKITTVEHLKQVCSNESREGFIALNGRLRSSKTIDFDGSLFSVYNHIDDTSQKLTESDLFTQSNIGEAIEKGAFYIENFTEEG